MTDESWPEEWRRGLLPYAVLSVLAASEAHGYAIIEALARQGLGQFKGGTLYPLLQRLEDQRLVQHRWEHSATGPGRKIFTLTAGGRDAHEDLRRAWSRFSEKIDKIGATP